MGAALGELQKIGLKLFAADAARVSLPELVPVFHRWVQSGAVPDHLLIDIADYEHVPEGPGVLLVAHEGNFSLDLGGGRMGLLYTRKQPAPGALPERLRAATRTALTACRLLEQEPALDGRLRFRTDELELFANDRLRAPNAPATLEAFQPALRELLDTLYEGAEYTVTPEADRRERFGVRVKAAQAGTITDLLQRL